MDSSIADLLRRRAPALFSRFYPHIDTTSKSNPATTKTDVPPSAHRDHPVDGHESGSADLGDSAEPEDVTRIRIDGKDVDFKDQIHLYAENKALTHPFVSPVLQPSLGGLPPLLIVSKLSRLCWKSLHVKDCGK